MTLFKNFLLLTFTAYLSSFALTYGQNAPTMSQPELDSGSIENRFNYILTKSTKFKEFQLIRKSSLLRVEKHALDSIQILREQLTSTSNEKLRTKQELNEAQSNIENLEKKVEEIGNLKESVSFLGMQVSKSGYQLTVWSIILLLLTALLVILLQFKNNMATTKKAKKELAKLDIEFESFRKKALKKEQEIMRKLQDEINKNAH